MWCRQCASGAASSQQLQELVERFKQRVEAAEEQLERVRVENKELRALVSSSSGSSRRVVVESCELHSTHNSTHTSRSMVPEVDSARSAVETVGLEREAREARAQVQLLQMRYDHLETKAKAQSELQKGSFEQLDEYNRRIRELRRALQDAQSEKETSDARCTGKRRILVCVFSLSCLLRDIYYRETVCALRMCAPRRAAVGGAGARRGVAAGEPCARGPNHQALRVALYKRGLRKVPRDAGVLTRALCGCRDCKGWRRSKGFVDDPQSVHVESHGQCARVRVGRIDTSHESSIRLETDAECSEPFSQNETHISVYRQDRAARLTHLEKSDVSARSKIEQLQEAAERAQLALCEMQASRGHSAGGASLSRV